MIKERGSGRLNYRHLQYFWAVARLGTLAQAARELHVSQPAISAQLRKLERSLGERLFERAGRTLQLTEVGRHVYGYADEIFSLGRELVESVRTAGSSRPLDLRVGVADVVPKLVVYRLLSAALGLAEPVRLHVHEARPEALIAELATHELDLLITDAPLGAGHSVRAFEHLLGECGISILAVPSLATSLRAGFPASLGEAPWLLPTRDASLRRSLDRWFADLGIRPDVVAEIEDGALLKAFGRAGAGVFASPSAVEREVRRQYGVERIGQTDEVMERFYAISVERRIRHPAVLAVTELARTELFPPKPGKNRRTPSPK
jgi:LysR family transcriptional activator of nhaA